MYRDDNTDKRIGDVEKSIVHLHEAMASFEKRVEDLTTNVEKARPVVTALANKIHRFDLYSFISATVFFIVVLAVLFAVGYISYMYCASDDIPDHCQYYKLYDTDKWCVDAHVDWRLDNRYCSSATLEEAKIVGKENGCPN